jgi:hypothetical protein
MADKTPVEKMRLKPGMTAALLHLPEGFAARLCVPEGVTMTGDPAEAGFLLELATTQAEVEERLIALRPHVREKTVAWMAYPKGSRAAGHDLNRDTIWTFAQTIDLVLVANVAIDETWSAVRLRPQDRAAERAPGRALLALAGSWVDERSAEEIVRELRAARRNAGAPREL